MEKNSFSTPVRRLFACLAAALVVPLLTPVSGLAGASVNHGACPDPQWAQTQSQSTDPDPCDPGGEFDICDWLGPFSTPGYCGDPVPPVPPLPPVPPVPGLCDIMPIACGPVPIPSPDVLPIKTEIESMTTYPDSVFVTDVFTIEGYFRNALLIPLLLTIEIIPNDNNICSLVDYGSQSGAASLREHEYLLMPNNTAQTEGTGGDAVTFSATVKANLVGSCAISVLAVVKTQAASVAVSTVDLPINVFALPKDADLGGIVWDDCADHFIKKPPTTLTPVEAGEVDVSALLSYSTDCDDDDSTQLFIERYNSASDAWDFVTMGAVSTTGATDKARGKVNLEEGTHKFKVSAYHNNGGWNWKCGLAVAGSIALGLTLLGILWPVIGGAAVALGTAAKIAAGGAFLSLVVAGLLALDACKDLFGNASDSYEVSITAKETGAITLEPPLTVIMSVPLPNP